MLELYCVYCGGKGKSVSLVQLAASNLVGYVGLLKHDCVGL